MDINGLIKLTLLDFPGETACTVFLAGCNLRCPFCHNASLVRGGGEAVEHISEEEFFSFLSRRKGMLDGVAVTGGEPLLREGLDTFLERIRSMGFKTKLDTNGTMPDRLYSIIDRRLADYVAMDIKSSPEGYGRAAGCAVDIEKIRESVSLLLQGNVEYEFRTTAAKGYVLPEDFEGIGRLIAGAERYFIQGFVDSGDLLGSGASAYSKDEMETFLGTVRKYVPSAQLRGVE